MKKPDFLVFLGLVVLLGAAVTGLTMDEDARPKTAMLSEHTIR